MTHGQKATLGLAGALLATAAMGSTPAFSEVVLLEPKDGEDGGPRGWRLSTDGRVNAFLSVGVGKGLPDEPDNVGAGTNDTDTSKGTLQSTRIRNGFIPSVFGFTAQRELSPNLKLTARVALWMNIAGSRTKNVPGLVDPRELYAKIEGPWGSLLAGSALNLFGRGGILVDYDIAHNYGLGYPCSIDNASGGSCGMVAFGAPFPGFDAGIIYTTPNLGGLEVSLGLYDPATIANGSLNRAPLPRFEGEIKYDFKQNLRLFANGFWQVLEGTVPDNSMPGVFREKDLHTNAWGGQAGAMLAFGPVMLGGAAYQGAGFSALTYIDEQTTAVDSAGTLRKSRGAFGLGAILFRSFKAKLAGGLGVMQIDKSPNDPALGGPDAGTPIKQNIGTTVGFYKAVGPLHLALEYFRAQHYWHPRAVANPADPNLPPIGTETPSQTVNFINAGMTIVW